MDIGEMMRTATFVARTPQRVTDEINTLCRELNPNGELVRVPVDDGWLAARPGYCYANVAEYTEMFGGRMKFGWGIFELPGVYLVAEHHAVVEQDDGTLLDVTPAFGDKEILFQPSAIQRIPGEEGPDNKYMPLHPAERIKRFVELMARKEQLSYIGQHDSPTCRKLDDECCRILARHFDYLKEKKKRKKK